MINVLDILIVIMLALTIAAGFFGGIVRLAAMAIAIYLSSIAAARWYLDLAKVGHRHINGFSLDVGQFVMFVAILAAGTIVLTPAIAWSIGRLKLPRRWQIADNMVGAGLGAVALALSLIPMSLVLQALNQTVLNSGGSTLSGMHDQIDRSALIPVFLRMAPVFVHMISPWFPGGVPPILSVVR
jgi:uncharacterized membrane protein required for colicin V production